MAAPWKSLRSRRMGPAASAVAMAAVGREERLPGEARGGPHVEPLVVPVLRPIQQLATGGRGDA